MSESVAESVANVFMLEDGRLRPVWRFGIAAIYAIAANKIGGMIAYGIVPRHPIVSDMLYRLLTAALLVVGFGYMLRMFDHDERDVASALTLPFDRRAAREFWLGSLLGIALITVAFLVIAILGSITLHVTVNGATVRKAAEVVLLLLAGALLEELMFRGYPFQKLIEAAGAPLAIILFSFLFGAAHLDNPNAGGVLSWGMFNTIAVGILFSIAYLKRGTLWLPWGLHFAWNLALGLIFGLPVSGMRDFSVIIRSQAGGSRLLTGGAYGPEASLTGAVVIVAGITVVCLLPGRVSRIAPRPEPLIDGANQN